MRLLKKRWVGWRETTLNRYKVGDRSSGFVNPLRPEIWESYGTSGESVRN